MNDNESRKPATKRHRKNGPVVVRRKGINHLVPMVRDAAMKLAKGDASKIEVVSAEEAIVR